MLAGYLSLNGSAHGCPQTFRHSHRTLQREQLQQPQRAMRGHGGNESTLRDSYRRVPHVVVSGAHAPSIDESLSISLPASRRDSLSLSFFEMEEFESALSVLPPMPFHAFEGWIDMLPLPHRWWRGKPPCGTFQTVHHKAHLRVVLLVKQME